MTNTAMAFAICIPDWGSLESVRGAHTWMEGLAIGCFATLVAFDVAAHLYDEKNKELSHLLEKFGLWSFAIAVVFEIGGFIYGQRNDTLSEGVIRSLSTTAGQAAIDSQTAITKSGTALTAAGSAQTNAESAGRAASEAKGIADTAKASAGTALIKADELQRGFASASSKLADLENKRKALENSLTNMAICTSPRILQVWALNGKTSADPLKSLAGYHAFISTIADPEARRASGNLSSILKAAGLTVSAGTSVSGNEYIPDGVTVEWYSLANSDGVFPSPSSSFRESQNAAEKVVRFLHSFNWQAKSLPGTPDSKDLGPKSIKIRVGLYPATEFVKPPAMASVGADWAEAIQKMKESSQVEFAKALAERTEGLPTDEAASLTAEWEARHREWEASIDKPWLPDTEPCKPIDAAQ